MDIQMQIDGGMDTQNINRKKYTDRYMDRQIKIKIDRWTDRYTNVDGISTMES